MSITNTKGVVGDADVFSDVEIIRTADAKNLQLRDQTAASVPNARGPDRHLLFFDASNGDNLSKKDHLGNVVDIEGLASTSLAGLPDVRVGPSETYATVQAALVAGERRMRIVASVNEPGFTYNAANSDIVIWLDGAVSWTIDPNITLNAANLTIIGSESSAVRYANSGGSPLFTLDPTFTFTMQRVEIENANPNGTAVSPICSADASKLFENVTVNLPDDTLGFIGDGANPEARVVLRDVTMVGGGINCTDCIDLRPGSSQIYIDGMFIRGTFGGGVGGAACIALRGSRNQVQGLDMDSSTFTLFVDAISEITNCVSSSGANLRISDNGAASSISNSVIGTLSDTGATWAGTRFTGCEFLDAASFGSDGAVFAACEFLDNVTPGPVNQFTSCVFVGQFNASGRQIITSNSVFEGTPCTFGTNSIITGCLFRAITPVILAGDSAAMTNCKLTQDGAQLELSGQRAYVKGCDIGRSSATGGAGSAIVDTSGGAPQGAGVEPVAANNRTNVAIVAANFLEPGSSNVTW
jgi:hypothetical protein